MKRFGTTTYVLAKKYKSPIGNKKVLHTRGLARPETRDYFLVGGSYFGDRDYRMGKKNGVVLQVDSKFNVMDYLIIPNLSQIYEIRLVNEPDLAHNKIVFKV